MSMDDGVGDDENEDRNGIEMSVSAKWKVVGEAPVHRV